MNDLIWYLCEIQDANVVRIEGDLRESDRSVQRTHFAE